MGPCPCGLQGLCFFLLLFCFLAFTRHYWGFCWFVYLDVNLLCSSRGQDYSVFFIFISIVPGIKQELKQYLPVAGGDGGGTAVESRVNRSTAK